MPWNLLPFHSANLPLWGASKLRIAQISQARVQGARFFRSTQWTDMHQFAPQVLVGSAADLRRCSERLDLGTITLDSLDHSVYVLTELGDKPLTEALRETLWQRFAVPVYELYLSGESGLLAFECEAREGWHIRPNTHFTFSAGELFLEAAPEKLIATGLRRFIQVNPCPCGRPGARLMPSSLNYSEEPYLTAIA